MRERERENLRSGMISGDMVPFLRKTWLEWKVINTDYKECMLLLTQHKLTRID